MKTYQSRIWMAGTLAAVAALWGLGAMPGAHGQERGPREGAATSGRVQELVRNDHGDVDGAILEDGTQIHFPPHEWDRLAALLAPGQRIDVEGREAFRPRPQKVIEVQRVRSGARDVTVEAPPVRPAPHGHGKKGPRPAEEQPAQVSGKVERFVTNREGDVDGFALADGTEVKVPPHQGAELQSFLKTGETVQVDGRRHVTPEGEVHLHADRISSAGRDWTRDEDAAGRRPPRRPDASLAPGALPAPPKPENAVNAEVLRELRELRRLVEKQRADR